MTASVSHHAKEILYVNKSKLYRGIRAIAPRLGLGFGSKLMLVLGEYCPLVRVRARFGVGGQFPSGVIFLEPFTGNQS